MQESNKVVVKARLWKAALALLVMATALSAWGEPARRSLELELEDIEGVSGYELRVTRILETNKKKPPIFFKIKSNKWSANLVPGRYELAVRSVDSRGVPGDWGAPQEFVVKLPAPKIQEPGAGQIVKSDDNDVEKVEFKWQPVEGATKYKFKLMNAEKGVIQESVTDDHFFKVKVPVAQGYTWQVTSLMGDVEGDTDEAAFQVYGAKLDQPRLKEIEETNTSKFEWSTVGSATKYDFSLARKGKDGNWKVIDHKEINSPIRKYSRPLPSGKYKVKIVAMADKRQGSDDAYKEFDTQLINRSPAAIEQIKSESSYETKSRFFALASYYISILQSSGYHADTGRSAPFSAIGGTGRLGAGTWFKDDGQWGGLFTADLSGLTTTSEFGDKQTLVYASMAAQAVYRIRLGAAGQMRANFGLQYRELPETIAFSDTSYTLDKVATAGPLLGLSLAHAFTRKIGFQINASGSHSTLGIKTPTGAPNIPKVSYQFGLLGSMNLSPSLVGFMGYAYRQEVAAYNFTPQPGVSTDPSPNELNLTGHYINLMLEYGF